jgi:hypothetical protein
MKTKITKFRNPRTGEVWHCPDLKQRRQVDGIDFVEVHKPDNTRMVWINIQNLVKVQESTK